MKRLIAIAAIVLTGGCDSNPVRPTATPAQPPAPVVNTSESGPVPIAGTPIQHGETVDVTVDLADPSCFMDWDSTARCRQFDFTAPRDGTLVAILFLGTPSRSASNPDVIIVAPDGDWRAPDFGWPQNRAQMLAKEGMSYRVVVLSYGPFPETTRLGVTLE
jgi:hypothetical protein